MYIMYITADNIVSSVLYYIPKLFDLVMCVTIREDSNQQLLMNNMQPVGTNSYTTVLLLSFKPTIAVLR